jgi:hypothetical protein
LNEKLSDLIQKRIAFGSITTSTVRKMGPAGTMRAAQIFLSQPALLAKFSKATSRATFYKILELQTETLRQLLPFNKKEDGWKQGGHWGCARKCLNIFLYECSLNRYLCSSYKILPKIEPWLEVPLDKLVGTGLDKEQENKDAMPTQA